MTAVAVDRRARRSEQGGAGWHQSRTRSGGLPARRCQAPRAAFAWATLSRRWMGDLIEALDRELPAVADLAVRLAIDLEVDQDIITQACS
jgi:hypothetical protein